MHNSVYHVLLPACQAGPVSHPVVSSKPAVCDPFTNHRNFASPYVDLAPESPQATRPSQTPDYLLKSCPCASVLFVPPSVTPLALLHLQGRALSIPVTCWHSRLRLSYCFLSFDSLCPLSSTVATTIFIRPSSPQNAENIHPHRQ